MLSPPLILMRLAIFVLVALMSMLATDCLVELCCHSCFLPGSHTTHIILTNYVMIVIQINVFLTLSVM